MPDKKETNKKRKRKFKSDSYKERSFEKLKRKKIFEKLKKRWSSDAQDWWPNDESTKTKTKINKSENP